MGRYQSTLFRGVTFAGLLCVATPLAASTVIAVGKNHKSIALTHDTRGGKWAIDDRVCVIQSRKPVVCGTVRKSSASGALAVLDTTFDNIAPGDEIQRQAGTRSVAASLIETSTAPGRRSRRFSLTAGVDVGTTFFFPMIHAQLWIIPELAVGLRPSFFTGSAPQGSVTAFGGSATVSYYSRGYYRGLWLQGAGGLFVVSADPSMGMRENATAPTTFATVGYRGVWKGINMGFGTGVFYMSESNIAMLKVRAGGVHPLFVADAGYVF